MPAWIDDVLLIRPSVEAFQKTEPCVCRRVVEVVRQLAGVKRTEVSGVGNARHAQSCSVLSRRRCRGYRSRCLCIAREVRGALTESKRGGEVGAPRWASKWSTATGPYTLARARSAGRAML